MAPQIFPVRDLRNHTSGVLAAARKEGEALISNRGKVVARLTPVDDDGPTERDEFFAWIAAWDPVDTGWAAAFEQEKRLDAEAAEAKPWE